MTGSNAATLPEGSALSLFEIGFRPFFLLGAVWAALAMVVWIAGLHGGFAVPSAMDPVVWHAHTMVYGFGGAIVAGFLLTAVPSWSGQPRLSGGWLAAFAGLWLAGRLAVAFSGYLGAPAAAVVDLAFLAILFGRTMMQVVAGRNWRNLPVAAGPALLLAGAALVHAQALGLGQTAMLGTRLGIAVFVLLVALIGGRIIPAFTRNWLVGTGRGGPLPSEFNRFDVAVIAGSAAALVAWLADPRAEATGVLCAIAAAGHVARLVRWQGLRTLSEPLLWVLHLGYAWMAVAFALAAASAALTGTVPQSAAVHAFTGGVIATMMLAMMTRATLGHTGRPLRADKATTAIYLLVTAAAVMRVLAGLAPAVYLSLLAWSAVAWIAAFTLYVAVYAPKLCRPRIAAQA